MCQWSRDLWEFCTLTVYGSNTLIQISSHLRQLLKGNDQNSTWNPCTWVYNKICDKYILDAVFCSYTWITHITLCAVGLQWHKMNRKYPDHPSSSLLTTAVEEKQTSIRLVFLFSFALFAPWHECICDRFDCRMCCDSHAGIFKWNFDNFLWETGWNVKESRLTCGSRAW